MYAGINGSNKYIHSYFILFINIYEFSGALTRNMFLLIVSKAF